MNSQQTETTGYQVICDERYAIIRRFVRLIKWWDRAHVFTFIDRDADTAQARSLVQELDRSPWSLLVVDESNTHWSGPEAVPIILKNLPFGKIAAVFYILPGTMWLTKQLYLFVSRNKRRLLAQNQHS